MASQGTRRSSVMKKRSQRSILLRYWANRLSIVMGVMIFFIWGMSWFFLSGTADKTARAVSESTLSVTADMGFAVENVLIEGRDNTDPELLMALLNIAPGDSLFAFNPHKARNLIEKIAWVDKVAVERRWPDTLYIRLEEHKPLALWQSDDGLALIGESGTVLTRHKLDRFRDYPLVSGDDAPNHTRDLITLINAEPVIAERLVSAARVSGRRWDLLLRNDIKINLPADNIVLALRTLAGAQEKDQLLEKALRSIDLRYPDRMVLRTAPGTVSEYKAGYTL